MPEVFEQFGPYKRIRRLGIGGMAETFLAVQRAAAGFEQRVCMKFILPGYREDADFRRLFLREASIAASLRHSNIVGVIDVDGVAGYMVLELVDGVDLRALLNAVPGRRLSPELAVFVTIELCKALAYAHARIRRGQPDGIVHRDVSPSNVLISYAGEVKLTDFGVARAMRADSEPLSTTVKGKLCYMSPEQARGLLLDGRSDLFAVGVVLYELLSGTRPFDGNTDAETLLRVTLGQHTPLLSVAPDTPIALVHIVEKLLANDREARFASADACIDALARSAPSATCFRELGQHARAARPHETLWGSDLEGSEPQVRRSDSRPTPGLPQPVNALTETVGLPDGMPLPPRTSGLVGQATTQARPRVHRNAWIALGVAMTALLIVTSIWLARPPRPGDDGIARAAADGGGPPEVTVTQQAVVDPGRNAVPGTAPPSERLERVEPAPLPGLAPAVSPSVSADPPSSSSSSKPGAVSPVPTAPVVPGSVTVGVVPTGQVWIDGRLRGYSPVKNFKLSPGKHVIAGGETRPQQRRTVHVKSGETYEVVIDLTDEQATH